VGDISEAVRLYDEMKKRLEAEVPDIDEETLLDTLEGETDLHERIASICRAAVEAVDAAEVCKLRMDELNARANRHRERAARLRGIALWALQESNIPKINAPDITVSVAKGRTSVIITDETSVPIEFVDYEPKIRRSDVKQALEDGRDVPGATLSNSPPSLTIRTK
jgi:hypothetical protein